MPWSDLADWWCDELARDSAYEQVVTPLLLEIEKWEDAFEDCGKYLESIPTGRYLKAARRWRNEAKVGLLRAGGSLPEAEPEAAAAEDVSE